jgi:polar amino acid transport system substrate-binding protein
LSHAWLTPFLSLAMLLGMVRGSLAQPKPLTWAADAEGGAPYIFKDPDNPKENIGFEVDLAKALARELGRPIEFKQVEFDSLIPGLMRGDFDFAMNGLEITPERKGQVGFSRPYYVYKLQLVARDDENRFKSLRGLADRKDITVATLEATAASRLLDRLGIKKKEYKGQVEPYADLALNRGVDAVLLDLPIALYYAQKDPKLKYAQKAPKLKFVGPPEEPGYYAIAFNLKNEALAKEIDAALDRLEKSGELRRIYEKWGLWNDDQNRGAVADVAEEPAEQYPFDRYFPLLLEGAGMTVYLSVVSMALAILLALPIALTRLYAPRPFRLLAMLYVEFFRGIPVLLLLYFLYFGLPVVAENYHLPWSLKLSGVEAAILGFGLNYAAYEAEIYRAGIGSIPVGQWEAAASLGMSSGLTLRRVILPQAIRVILPPMTNDFVALFKDTSIVSIIAVVELSKEYQILSKSSMKYLEIGLVTASLYLIMSVPLGRLSSYLEKRWGAAA